MKRRDFFAGFGVGAYTLAVLADRLPAAERPISNLDRLRRDLDSLSPAAAEQGRAAREPNMRLVELECDVLVAGGGLAGVCAAISAARRGARVILVQNRSRLGGNSSSEVKMHVVGSSCHKGRLGWRESGLIEEFRLDDAVNNPQRSFEAWDLLLYDKVVSEPNLTLLLDSALYSARMDGNRIESVMVRCDPTEHLYHVKAEIFVDCTGDCRLGLEAGTEYRTGRESRDEFGESLAIEKADEQTLASSILFTARDYGRPMPYRPPSWARKVSRGHLRHRRISSWEYGYWWIEWGGDHDTIRDNERIRFELLSIVTGVWDYIKNSGDHPSSETWAMDWIGFLPGKRGSRRLEGDHIVTQQDLERGLIEDAVAIGGWPMDDHPPGGWEKPQLRPNTSVFLDEVYNLPLRALYSRNVANLMMAGRNISCSHVAFTSTRVMGTCATVGQAAGTTAAMCVRERLRPRRVYEDKKKLASLQQALLRDDQTIRGLKNEDPADLAKRASIACSGEDGAGRAALLVDGHTRDYPREQGPEIHHWETAMGEDGAWVELSWKQPHPIGEVQLTFDTGFQRELTLSAQDRVNKGIIRAAQPETVRDYTVTLLRDGEAKQTQEVTGNHQRLNRLRFDRVEADAVRIHIQETNGDPKARVFEVRCYARGAAGEFQV